ncbi:MAG TPA: AfsR/SARP family transcriptional regulator [Nocardioides sp.]|nr:AfsR/SARP family transcriptional regulator [Nocardioides sp.]
MISVRVGILGTAVAVVDGAEHELGAARHRALLTVLALHVGQRVTTDSIIAALWGDSPPAGAAGTLQGYVADLRRVLEPRRAPREAPRVLVTVPSGYALHLEPDALDLTRFETALHVAARELEVVPDPWRPRVLATDRQAVARAADRLEAALDEWRGEPLSDLGSDLEVACERDRLHAMRLEAEVLRHTARLALGGHTTAVADLERLARRNPWNERVWSLWAVALAGSGKQAEALACLRRLRSSLSEELGLDPAPQVRELETAIVRHDLAPADAVRVPSGSVPPMGAVVPGRWPAPGRRDALARLLEALDRADETTLRALAHLVAADDAARPGVVDEIGNPLRSA